MPPKPRFTREEMVEAALDIVRKKGVEALTARELADVLGCSARPIFTAFENMDDLKREVRKAVGRIIEEYASKSMDYDPPFKKAGLQIIQFAINEPNLYKMIFMSSVNRPLSFQELFKMHTGDNNFEDVLIDTHHITKEQATYLFEHMWIYTYGISVLCALNMCKFSDDELSNMLGIEFLSLLQYVKNNNLNIQMVPPEKVRG